MNKNQIQYEISKRSKEYTSIVNKPLFYAMESILKVNSNDKIKKFLLNLLNWVAKTSINEFIW